VLFIVLVQMHFIHSKQFSETSVNSHAFQQISDLKIFPKCFRRPLKTLWRATWGRRAVVGPRWIRSFRLNHTNLNRKTSSGASFDFFASEFTSRTLRKL